MATQARRLWLLFCTHKRAASALSLVTLLVMTVGMWITGAFSQAPPSAGGSKPPQSLFTSGISVVVAGGDPSPFGGVFPSDGTPALGLGPNALNDAGDVVFYTAVADASALFGARPVILRKSGNTISKIIAAGDPAPTGGEFFTFFPPVANQSGDVAFVAGVKTGSGEQDVSLGMFLVAGGQVSTVVPSLPGTEEFWQRVPYTPALNNTGEVVMKLPVADDIDHQEIVRSTDGIRSKAAAEDDIKADPAVRWPSIADSNPIAVNDAGDVAVRADGPSAKILLIPRGQKPKTVISAGDPAPGGEKLIAVGPPTINNRGEIAFGAYLPPVYEDGPTGVIFVAFNGKLTPIAKRGDPTPTGETFTMVGSAPPLLNDRGDVLFVAGTNGKPKIGGLFPFSGGIFLYSQGQIHTVVTVGDPSPLGGVFLSVGPPVFNNTGTVAFNGIIDTDGDGNPNNQGIFAVTISPGK